MRRAWLHLFALVVASVSPASEPCPAIEGIDAILRPGRIVLLGETHGTRESPAFALDVACHAAHADLPVILGLEQPPAGQGRVDRYLDSEGGDADEAALLAGPLWQSSYQDGRASRAMLDLLAGVRKMRRAALPVSVSLFDASGRAGGQQRERAMARNLTSVAEKTPEAVLVVLTGNRHSRVTRGAPRNAAYEPMGYLLARATSGDRVVALDAAHGGGSAWVCAPDCGILHLSGHRGESPWRVEIDESTRPSGHDGWYHVGTITASPPATRGPHTSLPTGAAAEEAKPDVADRAASSHEPTTEIVDDRLLTEAESKFGGAWQAYDFGTSYKTYAFRFDQRRFRAEAGDEWYEGRIAIRPDEDPARIDFAIEDCRCSYKGMTSEAIYYWDDDAIVISAPQPGAPRPSGFVLESGQMMQLRKVDED